MSPYWQASDVTLYHGDARTVWRDLEPESVHAIVTSPPYYGLRDYGVDGQLGLEDTPQEYVDGLADLLTDWGTSVLRPDGSLWLNLGDTYAAPGAPTYYDDQSDVGGRGGGHGSAHRARRHGDHPAKCLLMIPERVALALIARGWILRNKIAWCKPNGMPSSAKDRLATKWEYLFFFTRAQRYWFDLDAIKEPPAASRNDGSRTRKHAAIQDGSTTNSINGDGWRAGPANPGDWWSIPTVPFPDAHFAVFPPELVRRPILATVPEQACAGCGKGRERIVETERDGPYSGRDTRKWHGGIDGTAGPNSVNNHHGIQRQSRTIGWSDCGCGQGRQPGVVADPFAGAGTTAVMARRLGRHTLLCELNGDYCDLIARRLAQDVLPFGMERLGANPEQEQT